MKNPGGMPMPAKEKTSQEENNSAPAVESRLDPTLAKHIQKTFQEIINNPSSYMDKGGAAKVYQLPSGLCMKVLEKRHDSPNSHLMKLGNTIQTESSFLERLSGFSHAGVRTPDYLGYARSPEFSAIFMERLDAVNLQRAIEQLDPFPKSFDPEAFFVALDEYMAELHMEWGVVHGDFEARNVMIDKKSGLPRVIDFGKSKWIKAPKFEKEAGSLIDEDLKNLEIMEQNTAAILQRSAA
jgi:tRNA A-37 threonylcarbamoyl transferase component Bud32